MSEPKGKEPCRWCRGTGTRPVLGVYGFPVAYGPCEGCAGAGLAALADLAARHPGPMSADEARALVEREAARLDGNDIPENEPGEDW